VGCHKQSATSGPPVSTHPAGLMSEETARELMMAGSSMSESQAAALALQVESRPSDLPARIQLLSYCFFRRGKDPQAVQARADHVLYIIRHHPAEPIAGLPPAQLHPVVDGRAYEQARDLWIEQSERYKDNPAVLGNAASFLTLHESEHAEKLLQRAASLEPDSPEWPRNLGYLYKRNMSGSSGQERQQWASKALEQLQRCRGLKRDSSQFYLLNDLAKTAFEAGDLELATRYSRELLDAAERHREDWNYGNAIHDGHLVLGRVALRGGNLDEAKQQLLESGKTPGSPPLNSFGPNLMLAKELIDAGERDSVLAYLEAIGEFWKLGLERLDQWKVAIRSGGNPDFGANLVY